MVTDTMRAVLKQNGWPEDLLVNVDKVTLEVSAEVMKQCDLILATGGAGMVKAAYSSGKPCFGVGAGNAPMIVDETADLKDAANKIMRSKTFDQATSCSTENSVVIQEAVYDDMVKALQAEGGYLINATEKPMLQKAMWDEKGMLSRKIVAQPAAAIAAEAGFDLPAGKTFLMVEETGIGHDYPFSREKLSVVTTLYRYKEFEDAINFVNTITAFEGPGHSCGIHTTRDDRIMELAHRARVSRVMIRQGQCLANSGNWFNGMPMTMTLGCGSWGGNSASKNITWTDLMNVTWVSYPIEGTEPPDEELFGPEIMSA